MLLTSGRVEIRVVPKDRMLVHGKAGVIEGADGAKTCFLDSINEAHKARRRGGLGKQKDKPNNLLDFMLRISPRAKNVLLGTATPIQTEVHELWDLLRILASGADFMLGRELSTRWGDCQRSLPIVKGTEIPAEDRNAWEWLRNPLPPASEDALFATLRLQLGLPDQVFFTDRGFGSLGFLEQQAISQALAPGFLREHNQIVRHTVLRKRVTLEDLACCDVSCWKTMSRPAWSPTCSVHPRRRSRTTCERSSRSYCAPRRVTPRRQQSNASSPNTAPTARPGSK